MSRPRRLVAAIFAAIAVVLTIFLVFDVSSKSSSSVPQQNESYVGAWSTSPKADAPQMKATVGVDTIEIQWVMPDSTALYWKGTFPASDPLADGTVIVSQADRTAMDESLFASRGTDKGFTYRDGKLSFQFTALGVTKTVYLEK